MRKFLIFLLLLISTFMNAQNSLNDETIKVETADEDGFETYYVVNSRFLRIYNIPFDTAENRNLLPNLFFAKAYKHGNISYDKSIFAGGRFTNNKTISLYNSIITIDGKPVKTDQYNNTPNLKDFMKKLKAYSTIEVICNSESDIRETFYMNETLYNVIKNFYKEHNAN